MTKNPTRDTSEYAGMSAAERYKREREKIMIENNEKAPQGGMAYGDDRDFPGQNASSNGDGFLLFLGVLLILVIFFRK